MPSRKKPGKVRELVPGGKRISYKLHGHWVRSKLTGNVGKIAYFDRVSRLVAVVWEPATKAESDWPTKVYSASLSKATDLIRLKGYDPEPWYDFKEMKRREKALDGE